MQYFIKFTLLTSYDINLRLSADGFSITDCQNAALPVWQESLVWREPPLHCIPRRPSVGFLSNQTPVDVFDDARMHVGCCPVKRA
jgi:hypothetical protein